MQDHDLSTMTPATRAVFDAVHYLGQGNVHELAEQSGKARSTVDKAIKALSDAGLIVPVDTDADAAEGVPTRWTMAEGVADSVTADDTDPDTGAEDGLDDAGTAGDFEPGSDDAANNADDLGDDSETDDNPADDDPQPGTEPDSGEATGQEDTPNADDQTTGHDAQDETLQSTDAGSDTDNQDPDAVTDEDENPDGDSDDDDQDPDESDDEDEDDESDGQPKRASVTVVQQSRPGDRKVMTIKAVLAEYGDDGATLDEIVNESGIGHPTTSRLLTAMEQADAARRLPGTPGRWIAGPTKASEVDPNPEPTRCAVCYQVIKGVTESPEAVAQVQSLIRPDGTLHVVAEDGTAHVVKLPKRQPIRTASAATAGAIRRTDITVNADGSQPFAKGELEKLTMSIFAANPGREMTPQDIATAISAQLGGREVSSGAVRNNCGKLGAAGRILMVSDSPWRFVLPAQAEDADADQADDAMAEQS